MRSGPVGGKGRDKRQKTGKSQRSGAARGNPRSKSPERQGEADKRTAKALAKPQGDRFYIYGRHAVGAALANPRRHVRTLYTGPKLAAEERAKLLALRDTVKTVSVDSAEIAATFPAGTPHQDVTLEVAPLSVPHLDEVARPKGPRLLLMLDQVTDPHNVGACIRSAAALGAAGLITQDRNSPQENGALARAASGGLETLPWCRVTNLSHTLDSLKDQGYWVVGMAGESAADIDAVEANDRLVIVMGSEGAGLRPLVAKHCDLRVRIPMTDKVESLNVSVATAIALYALKTSS